MCEFDFVLFNLGMPSANLGFVYGSYDSRKGNLTGNLSKQRYVIGKSNWPVFNLADRQGPYISYSIPIQKNCFIYQCVGEMFRVISLSYPDIGKYVLLKDMENQAQRIMHFIDCFFMQS